MDLFQVTFGDMFKTISAKFSCIYLYNDYANSSSTLNSTVIWFIFNGASHFEVKILTGAPPLLIGMGSGVITTI